MSRIKGPLSSRSKNRAYIAFIIGAIIYALLIYRLVDIQIIKGEEYTNKQLSQGSEKVDLNSGRGIIYDRNNKPLTDTEKSKVLIIQSEKLSEGYKTMNLIKEATKLEYTDIAKMIEDQMPSSSILIETGYIDNTMKEKLEENEIIIEEKTSRYSENGLLSHTIGHLKKSDSSGQMGIEKSMDSILKDSNEQYVSAFKAGDSGNREKLNILKGSIATVKEKENDRHIRLTIDSNIQKKVEEIVDKEENPTAVVISDVDTGEVLSISSRPNFDPNNIYEETIRSQNEKSSIFLNRAANVTYPPGSVFKIVVLYAAFENRVIGNDYTYNCTGKTLVGNDEYLKCHKLDGHGLETLEQAFANSCNTAFYDIANKVGEEKILEAAKALHVSDKIDIGIDEERSAKIPDNIEIRNLAIGQGGIEFTPLQINQLTQIVANNGTYKPLYIYDSIIDNDKNIIKPFKVSKDEEIISPYSITRIKEMMKSVSKEGTAKELSDLSGKCGVKTGTAQSSLNGVEIAHGWITGFYPAENPKYAITVLVEGTDAGNKSAIPIFKEICEKINKK